jgi:hypothetical protein
MHGRSILRGDYGGHREPAGFAQKKHYGTLEISELLDALRSSPSPTRTVNIFKRFVGPDDSIQRILSDRQGAVRLPSRSELGDEGFVLSPFKGDCLTFLNNSVVRQMENSGLSKPLLQVEILFDSNAAGLIRGLVANKNTPQIASLREFFRQIDVARFNWNSFPYLIENLEAIERMERLSAIYETSLRYPY